MPYANNKGTDQPALPCKLISAFVICCLDSIILRSCYIQIFKNFASFCRWAGQSESYLVANSEDRFSRDMAYMFLLKNPLLEQFERRVFEYHKCLKQLDTHKNCCNDPKIWTMWFYYHVMCPNCANRMADTVVVDQTASVYPITAGH